MGLLDGRVALIVNCCSPLGEAFSRRLGCSGARLILNDPNTKKLEIAAKQLEQTGIDAHAIYSVADLTKQDQRITLFEQAFEKFGTLNCFLSLTSSNEVVGDIVTATAQSFDRIMDKFLTSQFRLCKDAIPFLEASKNGSILFVTSIVGFTPFLDVGLYAVAQSGVLGMCKALAASAAKHGVRVNSISTGMVAGDGSGAIWDKQDDKDLETLRSMIPLGRIGRPKDCAGLAEFLLSDRARYITGENTVVAGGINVRY